MTVNLFALRALFPNHFSRRGDDTPTSNDGRAWRTLRLPNLRVVGPYWSIVVNVENLASEGYDISLLAERYEVQPALIKGGSDPLHHPASGFAVRPTALWNTPDTQFKTQPEASGNSRLSLIAAASFTDASAQELALPFVDQNGDAQGSGLLDTQGALVLQPLGRIPEHSAGSTDAFLTAMRLSAGQIATRARDGYMTGFRAALGVQDPGDSSLSNALYFLPDGVGFRAKIALPWQDEPVETWLRLGLVEGDRSSGALRVWGGPDARATDTALYGALDALKTRLTAQGDQSPTWMSVEIPRDFGPRNLVWPTTQDTDSVLQKRAPGDVWLEGRSVQLRLGAEGAGSGADQMTLLLPSLRFFGAPSALEITAKHALDDPATNALSGLKAVYAFKPDGETGHVENVTVGRTDPQDSAAEFVLPALSTAQTLAADLDIPPPEEPRLIWCYTPVSQGWLHWPLPHATTENTYDLIRDESPPPRADGSLTSGRFQLGAGADTETPAQRPWRLTVFGARRVEVTMALTPDGIDSAHITLDETHVSVDGLLPVTPFRQTSERLLPGAAERAITTRGLTGITENQLSDIEARVYQAGLATKVAFENLTATADRNGAATLSDVTPATVSVSLPDTGASGADLWAKLDTDIKPWGWFRHAKMPTVQAMALAETGGAEKQPSANRELAPFVIDPGDGAGLTLGFETLTNMSAEAPILTTDELKAERPSDGLSWRDEAGMVPTTLSSAIIMPGLANANEEPLADKFWAMLETPTTLVLRHDIPATDELWTQAKLPPPEPTEDDAEEQPVEPSLGFAPQPDNGPGPKTARSNAWRGIWAARNRALALAALDRRTLIERQNTGDLVAANLLGDVAFPVSDLAFTPDIGLDLTALEPALTHVGSVSFRLNDHKADGTATHGSVSVRGLPDVSDLEGMGGTFTRADGMPARLRFGTLQAGAAAPNEPRDTPMDQLGLTAEPAQVVPGSTGNLTRTIRRYVPDREAPLVWTQLTLTQPAKFGDLELLLVDIPFAEGVQTADLRRFWRDETGVIAADALAHSGPDLNHIAGFSWGLRQGSDGPDWMPPGMILVEGWLMSPRALLSVSVTERFEVETAEIACQMFTRARHGDTVSILPTDGQVRITLGATPRIVGFDNVHVPVADAARTDATVPLLSLGPGGSSLEFPIGDTAFSVDGTIEWDHERKVFVASDGKTDQPNTIKLTNLESRFDEGEEDGNAPASLITLQGQTTLSAEDTGGDFDIGLDLTLDLLAGTLSEGSVSVSLYGANLTFLLRDTSRFDGTQLALDFDMDDDAQRLFGLPVTKAKGTLLAQTSHRDGEDLAFTVIAKALLFTMELGEGPTQLTLEANTLEAPDKTSLSGTLSCDSIFAWPTLNISGTEATWPVDAARTVTSATAEFARAALPLVLDADSPVRAQADVTHAVGGIAFRVRQTVVLYGPGALRRYLDDADGAALSIIPSAPTKADAPVHMHSTGDVALPSGLGPTMRSALSAALNARSTFGAVDLSGHHWLRTNTAPGQANPFPLPFLAVFGEPLQDPITAAEDAVTFGLLPLAPLDVPKTDGLHNDPESVTGAAPGRCTFVPRATPRTALAEDMAAERRLRVDVAAMIAVHTASDADDAALSLARDGAVRHGAVPAGTPPGASSWDVTAGAYEAETYATMWRLLADETPPHILAAPRAAKTKADALDTIQNWRLQVYALSRDGESVDLIGFTHIEAKPTDDAAPDLSVAADNPWTTWAQSLMARLAPHTRRAMIMAQRLDSGRPILKSARIVDARSAVERPSATLTRGFAVKDAQGQFRAHMQAMPNPARISAGYDNHAVTPVAATSDTPHQDGVDQTENRLTVSGLTLALRLSGQDQRALTENPWIVSREQVAFRVAAQGGPSGPDLYPALPPRSRAQLSPASTPATQGEVSPPPLPSKKNTWTRYVPAYLEETTLGGRPGAWIASRHSVEVVHPDPQSGVSEVTPSAQIPVWAKSPRPLELGRNDRTRASSHERPHMALDWQPTAVIHGPAAPPGEDPVGLDRSPRSLWATLLKIERPAGGILPENWDGQIELIMGALTPLEEEDPEEEDQETENENKPGERQWRVTAATLEAPGLKLRWPAADDTTEEPDRAPKSEALVLGTPVVLSGFRPPQPLREDGMPNDDTPLETAAERIARLPPATPVQLTLRLQVPGLTRMVTFELLTGGDALRSPSRPLYLRFDDPAYNDRLGGLATLDRADVDSRPDTEMIFASDVKDARPSDFITFALGLRSSDRSNEPAFSDDPKPTLSFERRRPGEDGAEVLHFPPANVGGILLDKLEFSVPQTDSSSASTAVLLSDLRLPDAAPDAPVLLPGDRLVAIATAEGTTIRLRYDVVETPNLPENTAFFGLHGLDFQESDPDTAKMSVPISGYGRAPAEIEVVDPTELLRGSVRRRASYRWRTFEVPQADDDARRFALLKRTRTGATWLPTALATDWIVPGTEILDDPDGDPLNSDIS